MQSTGKRLHDIGGNPELKAELSKIVNLYRNRDFFESYGAVPPKGVLFYGPPGTGKTLAAEVLAGEADVPFYHLKLTEIVNCLVGESEKRLAEFFASVESPAIVFIDEIDSIGANRRGSQDHHNKLLGELLKQIDGFAEERDLLILGATNIVEELDPALTRPGRLDLMLLVDRPDLAGRREIFGLKLDAVRARATHDPFDPALDVERLANGSEDMVGAGIEAAVNKAVLNAVNACLGTANIPLVTTASMLAAIAEINQGREERRRFGFAPK